MDTDENFKLQFFFPSSISFSFFPFHTVLINYMSFSKKHAIPIVTQFFDGVITCFNWVIMGFIKHLIVVVSIFLLLIEK